MNQNILHITDLHIGAKDNPDDFLREGFYRDYIDKLYIEISSQIQDINCLIISGDYINAIANETPIEERFEHASCVVKYIQDKFNIAKSKTFSCIGNHDFILEEESNENYEEARRHYNEYIPKFSAEHICCFEQFAFLYKDAENYILSLDSTLKSKGKINPGVIETKEIDGCINLIRDNVPRDAQLTIIMHYPFIEVTGTVSALEEPGWEDKHIWKSAFYLRKRIEDLRDKVLNNTCVIFGDIHILHSNIHEGIVYLSSGRFGTNIFKPKESNPDSLTMQPRQARVYSINSELINCITASWSPISHKENSHLGNWEVNTANIKVISKNPIKKEKEEDRNKESKTLNKLQVFSKSTEDKILKDITNFKMYKFGRFNTAHDNFVSLAWILVNKLLNNQPLLCNIIQNMKDWIDNKSLVKKDTMLIGLDCWGNVISSQLSSYTNIVNYCTVSRAEGKHSSPDELLCDKIKTEFKKYSNIIIITDVVATGNGTDFIYKNIKSVCSGNASFYVFSIIADELQNHFMIENYTHVTSCTKLRIPIIEKDKLPSEDILPSTVAFNKSE